MERFGYSHQARLHAWSTHKLSDFPVLLRNLFLVKAAAAHANQFAPGSNVGLLKNIESAALGLASNLDLHRPFDIEALAGGGGILVHHSVDAAILSQLKEEERTEAQEWVNRSQSTADVCATAIRLTIGESYEELSGVVLEFVEILDQKIIELAGIPSISRTCLRDALPTTLGEKFQPFAHIFREMRDRILNHRNKLITNLPLGGTVIGSGAGAGPEYRSHIEASLNGMLPYAVKLSTTPSRVLSQGDDIMSVHYLQDKIATHLSRLCKILRLMHSGPNSGFQEIELPLAIEGSMFFANKNNPTIPETVLQASATVLGHSAAAARAHEIGDPDLNVFEWFSGVLGLLSSRYLTASLHMLGQDALKGMKPNLERIANLKTDGSPRKSYNQETKS